MLKWCLYEKKKRTKIIRKTEQAKSTQGTRTDLTSSPNGEKVKSTHTDKESPIQRIAVIEKYRPIYERQAQENQSKAGGDKKSENYKKSVVTNSSQVISNKRRSSNVLQMEKNEDKPKIIHTDKEIAKMAGVSEKTYCMGAKVLNSNNEDIKQRVMSGETSISAGYKEPV